MGPGEIPLSSEERGSVPAGCARSCTAMPDHRRGLLRPGTEGLRWQGVGALSRGLHPGPGSDSWLCHFLAGWSWQVTSVAPLLYRVNMRARRISAHKALSTELVDNAVTGL